MTTMGTLAPLRGESDRNREIWLATIRAIAPHLNEFDWYRARSAQRGELGRHNEDKRFDVALSRSAFIESAHDAYIKALHTFYRARDGAGGVLGNR